MIDRLVQSGQEGSIGLGVGFAKLGACHDQADCCRATQQLIGRQHSANAGLLQLLRSKGFGRHMHRHVARLGEQRIARDGMSLGFENDNTAVDERWATIGAGVLVFFVSVIDGQRKRTSVFGRIRQREAHGLVIRLLGLEEDTVAALNYLLTLSGAKRAKASPPPALAVSLMLSLIASACLVRSAI